MARPRTIARQVLNAISALVASSLGRKRFTRQSFRDGRIATDAVVPEMS
jgi:hypothetical protein